jgi:hypothetical protein
MRIAVLSLAVVLAWGYVSMASGASLSIYGSPSPLEIASPTPNQANIGSMLIGINNGDVPGDSMTGWQLRLAVTGGTGNLLINGASLPSSNYVFEGDVFPLSTTPSLGSLPGSPSSTLFATTATFSGNGVLVPATDSYLLNISFSSGAIAPSGTFEIVALPGIANSVWTDENFTTREFDNLVGEVDPIVIGTITIVPEPGTAVLMFASAGLLVGMLRRKQRLHS